MSKPLKSRKLTVKMKFWKHGTYTSQEWNKQLLSTFTFFSLCSFVLLLLLSESSPSLLLSLLRRLKAKKMKQISERTFLSFFSRSFYCATLITSSKHIIDIFLKATFLQVFFKSKRTFLIYGTTDECSRGDRRALICGGGNFWIEFCFFLHMWFFLLFLHLSD